MERQHKLRNSQSELQQTETTRHIRKVSIVRLLKKTKIDFQNMLLLSDSPYLKLLFYTASNIIKAFIIKGTPVSTFSLRRTLPPVKTPLTTDDRPLRGSSCTLSRPSLGFLTHSLTIPSLMAFSTYASHIWQWISAGFTFLAFKKRITIFHSRRGTRSSWTF